MRYADLLARITGLCVAVAGATLIGRALVVAVPGGVRGIGVIVLGIGVVGVALLLAGTATGSSPAGSG